MDILKFSKEHDSFRERLRAFLAKEITPMVHQWEKEHIVPRSAWQKMGKAGFLCPAVAQEYGGLGGDFLHSFILAEELSYTAQSGLAGSLHSDVIVPYIDAFGSEEQKKTYLPKCVSGDIITAIAMTEPDAGSDLAGMKTTAVQKGNNVIINGAKTFISNGIMIPPGLKGAGSLIRWGGTARTRQNCFLPTAASPKPAAWENLGQVFSS